jgi:hypothetical protein
VPDSNQFAVWHGREPKPGLGLRSFRNTSISSARRAPSKMPVDNITFPEFVPFVAVQCGPGALDQHWKPNADLCRLRDIKYDFVGRYERLKEDADRLLRRIRAAFVQTSPFPGASPPALPGRNCVRVRMFVRVCVVTVVCSYM